VGHVVAAADERVGDRLEVGDDALALHVHDARVLGGEVIGRLGAHAFEHQLDEPAGCTHAARSRMRRSTGQHAAIKRPQTGNSRIGKAGARPSESMKRGARQRLRRLDPNPTFEPERSFRMVGPDRPDLESNAMGVADIVSFVPCEAPEAVQREVESAAVSVPAYAS
jgi:hypothetical protein